MGLIILIIITTITFLIYVDLNRDLGQRFGPKRKSDKMDCL